MTTPIAVTIAGSDSSGGAGIQADLKTFSAFGVYGASVLTALTAQNTRGVSAIHAVPPAFVRAQMDAVYDDLDVRATKIGMLASPAIIEAVAAGLEAHEAGSVVLDPVMIATTGAQLIEDAAVDALIAVLFPLSALVTPNLHEAARLLKAPVATSLAAQKEQALAIVKLGARAALVKGGHAFAEEGQAGIATDVLATAEGLVTFSSPRIDTLNTHGTGCTLSSAIAAGLARANGLEEAVGIAKTYIAGAIAAADSLTIGKGHGPVHHFHAIWERT